MAVMVKEVMDTAPPKIGPGAKIQDAIRILVKHNVNFIPVVNEAGLVVGGLSENDLMKLVRIQPLPTVSAVWTKIPKGITEKTVMEIMSPRPITINDRASINDALNLMNVSNVNTLIVLDINNKLAGLVKFRQLIEKMLESGT
jgi:predicted transcriptional regulator